MSGPSSSQAEKKTVSIWMDEIGYLEINITVTGKEVVLEKDGERPTKIKYKNNLKIIIKDPEAGHKADPPKADPPKVSPKADPPKAGPKAGPKADPPKAGGHGKN